MGSSTCYIAQNYSSIPSLDYGAVTVTVTALVELGSHPLRVVIVLESMVTVLVEVRVVYSYVVIVVSPVVVDKTTVETLEYGV